MKEIRDICVIAQGGGLKSAYSVGVIRALREKYSLEEVENIVGSSGAVSTFAYFITKQYDLIEKIWIELIKSGKFIKIRNFLFKGPIMDVDFLVDVVLKQKFPLDIASLRSSKTGLFIPLLRYSDCKGIYFTNHGPENPYEIIRAACAVPYFFGKRIELNGTEYVDGTISEQFGLRKALELKPKNLLVILTRPPKKLPRFTFVRKILEFLWIRKESEAVRKAIWDMPKNYEIDRNKILELKEQINVAVIQPAKELPTGRLGINLKSLQKTIDQGYKDTINNPELDEFFKKTVSQAEQKQ